ncbi:nucleotidyl transferase AbiEii/AbiGii toxin family protein, partial [Klebsiella pneumoniae]|uniref:nucleotidyl transferase AbiEii/AbiGii toxin family protein n=1 Tax=Klebsiella pneumoniae TaxID=573 RepID=UPI001F4BB7BB
PPPSFSFFFSLPFLIFFTIQDLVYCIKCKVQSHKIQPNAQGTVPTVQINIAFCDRSNASAMKRLESNQSPSVINIDFSFNENTYDFDFLSLDGDDDNDSVKTYSLNDLMAEKYRSILKQKKKKRNKKKKLCLKKK